MADGTQQGAQGRGRGGDGGGSYAPGNNPADPTEHRHGDLVHSHHHTGPHEHGDDLEYDEAHDPERAGPPGGRGAAPAP